MLFPSNLKSDVARDDLQERLLVQHSITTVVATLFGIVATLFQHCYDVLRSKSTLRIVSCNITFNVSRGGDSRETKLTVSQENIDFAMLPAQRFWRETVSLLDVM